MSTSGANPPDPGVVGDLAARIEALEADNARLVDAVAARDAFLAVAAHELRNPMTPILGRVTLLRRSVARAGMSPDEIAKSLERIEKLVVHFIDRATTLLDVSRADSEHVHVDLQAVNASQLTGQVCENYQPAVAHAGASLAFDGSGSGGVMVAADPLALQQVLENLLSNAIKYGAGAPIEVRVAAVPQRGQARITVTDAGPGIPHAHQSRIFERYERAVRAGSEITGYGVGLWIVRTLCEAMGGTVEVASSPGAGATFIVSMPLNTTEEAP